MREYWLVVGVGMLLIIGGVWFASLLSQASWGAAEQLTRSPTGLTEIEMPHAWCYAWGDRTLSCVPKRD